MKAKLIILTAIVAVLIHSCSGERDNENVTPTLEKTRPENFKLNKNGQTSKSVSDTIIVRGLNMPEDPEIDGGDPTTITPPHR
ncbi:hypothetical protein [Chryseobacterium sp. MYb328]|uniref:hypothetical protein n=1 Tax=Chryseobacterium sp. MYb328 TaxID=2745231 RepID=UPI0030B697FD